MAVATRGRDWQHWPELQVTTANIRHVIRDQSWANSDQTEGQVNTLIKNRDFSEKIHVID